MFSIVAVSCLDQPDCYQLNNNYLGVVFKIIGGGTDRVYLSSVQSPGAGEVLEKPLVTTEIGLPLNPYASETSFLFSGYYAPADAPGPELLLEKALNLSYLARVQFVSEDCGERHVFTDVAVPSTDFDSVRILNSVPTNPTTTNLELFRCPRTNLVYVDFLSDVIVKTISVRELSGTLFTVNDTISSILLPLVQERDTTTFDFVYANEATRTLMVSYRTTTRQRFEFCGEQTFIDRITNVAGETNFATVTVKEDSIYDLPRINLEITP